MFQKAIDNDYSELWRGLRLSLGYSLLFVVVVILVINISFLFNDTLTPFASYSFRSTEFQSIQNYFRPIARLPIPVPYPYLEGMDRALFNNRTGSNYGNVYLLGEIRQGGGFPGYFLIASLLKVPLPILALFFISLIGWVKEFAWDEFRRREMYLLIPALVFAIYFNFLFQRQIGIRVYLVTFPILLIFSSRIFARWERFSGRVRFAYVLLGAYLVLSVASYFPHYLSYFNELVLDRKQAYRLLSDSNIDWGQNRAEITEYLATHPAYVFEPEQPTSGLVVVGVNELTGVLGDPNHYAWLRDDFEPVGHLDYTYLIYDIHPSNLSP